MESLISIHKLLTFRACNRGIFRCMKTFLFCVLGTDMKRTCEGKTGEIGSTFTYAFSWEILKVY